VPDGLKEAWPTRPDTLTVRRSRVAQAIVTRAWRAAVLGFLTFPPLGLYSLWLLYRLLARNLPLTATDRFRCRAAVVVDVCAIAMGLLLAVALVFVLSYSIDSFVSDFFSFARGVSHK
jgi:hypothetical protein